MHKKLEAELVSLAHSILQLKNKDDINALHKKALEVYEKLSVLKFVDEYMNTSLSSSEEKDEIIDKVESVMTDVVQEVKAITTNPIKEVAKKSTLIEEQTEEVFSIENAITKKDEKEILPLQTTLEDELKDAISADVATQLFEKATKENPVILDEFEAKKRSLNDTLFKNNLQVGLNDRIAFVKHLFDGSQEDFNRVLSQLNTFKTEKEAVNFIHKLVKPDYDWTDKEEYEQRLVDLIQRKFL